MTVRLNGTSRAQIINALIVHKFADGLRELIAEYSTLANDTYSACFKQTMRDEMYSLREGWLPSDDDIHVQFGASHVTLKFNGDLNLSRYSNNDRWMAEEKDFIMKRANIVLQPVWKLFPYSKKGTCVKVFNATDPYSTHYELLTRKRNDFFKSISEARRAAAAVVNNCATVKTLLEAWPEIEPFTRDVAPAEARQLPVVQTDKLNSIFGLPVADAAE